MTEIKVGDRVRVIATYGGPFEIGHVGTVTYVGRVSNICATVDDEWNFPIDEPHRVFLQKVARYMENK